jgi:hypothetical protein
VVCFAESAGPSPDADRTDVTPTKRPRAKILIVTRAVNVIRFVVTGRASLTNDVPRVPPSWRHPRRPSRREVLAGLCAKGDGICKVVRSVRNLDRVLVLGRGDESRNPPACHLGSERLREILLLAGERKKAVPP